MRQGRAPGRMLVEVSGERCIHGRADEGAEFVGEAQIDGLGRDEGSYSFRQWSTQIAVPRPGKLVLQARCTNTKGEAQPVEPNWNAGGFMRNVIERVELSVA